MRLTALLLLTLLVAGCGGRKPVSFRDDIKPVLTARCVRCHSRVDPAGKITLTSYEAVMNSRTVNGKKPIVVSENLSASWVYLLAGTDQARFRMPPDTSHTNPLTKDELQLLSRWILEGAKNN